MLANSRAVPVVRNQCQSETSLDAGVAQCRWLDKVLRKRLEADSGVRLPWFRARALASEAEWVATDVALYYVWPDVEQLVRVEWSEIETLSLSRASRIAPVRGGKVRHIRARTRNGASFEIQTGSLSAESVRQIASERGHWTGLA